MDNQIEIKDIKDLRLGDLFHFNRGNLSGILQVIDFSSQIPRGNKMSPIDGIGFRLLRSETHPFKLGHHMVLSTIAIRKHISLGMKVTRPDYVFPNNISELKAGDIWLRVQKGSIMELEVNTLSAKVYLWDKNNKKTSHPAVSFRILSSTNSNDVNEEFRVPDFRIEALIMDKQFFVRRDK